MEISTKGSPLVYDSSLTYEIPPTQGGKISSERRVHFPQPGYLESDDAPIVFDINAIQGYYIQLNESYMYFRLKLVKEDGTTYPGESDVIAPNESFFGSYIDSAEFFLNNASITNPSQGIYPYRHFFHNLLKHRKSLQDSTLSMELWEPDDKINDFTTLNNAGMVRRMEETQSKPFELIGHIHESLSDQTKLIPDFLDIKLVLKRTRPNFHLCSSEIKVTSPPPFKIVIDKCFFVVKRYLISPKLIAKHHALLNSKKRITFPLVNEDIQTISILPGTYTVDSKVVFNGIKPEFLVVGFVETTAFTGHFGKSPYAFKHHNVKSISVSCEGDRTTYYKQVTFGDNFSLLGYKSLSEVWENQEGGLPFNRWEYKNRRFLTGFELDDREANGFIQPRGNHTTKISVEFSPATEKALTCVVFAQIHSILQITKEKEIITNFH